MAHTIKKLEHLSYLVVIPIGSTSSWNTESTDIPGGAKVYYTLRASGSSNSAATARISIDGTTIKECQANPTKTSDTYSGVYTMPSSGGTLQLSYSCSGAPNSSYSGSVVITKITDSTGSLRYDILSVYDDTSI